MSQAESSRPPQNPAPDEQLKRAIAGDRDALSRLLQEHGPAVRRQVSSMLPQRWQALLSLDDIMQQAYTDAFLGIKRFKPRGDDSFLAWLVTLARRNVQDAIRMLEADKRGGVEAAVARQGSTSVDLLYERLAGSVTTPSRQLARQEAQDALLAAVAQLPQLHRQVVQAIDLDGRSPDDVARELGRSRGSIGMLRCRAHRWLAEILGGAGNISGDGP